MYLLLSTSQNFKEFNPVTINGIHQKPTKERREAHINPKLNVNQIIANKKVYKK